MIATPLRSLLRGRTSIVSQYEVSLRFLGASARTQGVRELQSCGRLRHPVSRANGCPTFRAVANRGKLLFALICPAAEARA